MCASGLCLLATDSEGTTGKCTRSCADRACPLGDDCDFVESLAVCVPPTQSTGGCSVGGSHGPSSLGSLLVLAIALRRRSKKGSGK